jgi:C4-dicarboxylate-specific signal transduction histidine kinase
MVRLHPANETATDLTQDARAALEVTAYGARSSGIVVESRFAEGSVLVSGDADHLTQVAANFLVNAQHALMGTPDERRIVISTFRKSGGINGFSIEDNGAGIPEAIRHRNLRIILHNETCGRGHRNWPIHFQVDRGTPQRTYLL